MSRIAVLGAGSWGTAFSLVLADAGHEVDLWCRRPELAKAINSEHCNADYLPDVRLPRSVVATADIDVALREARLVVVALPSQRVREHLGDWAGRLDPTATVLSLCKGIELSTASRISEVIREVTGLAEDRVAVLTGPNLASEVAARQPSASVIACTDAATARFVQLACHTPNFRPYTHTDVIGAELGGAVKNVIALAVGMARGMGLGDNTAASIITRGLAETARLGHAVGADPYTFSGLAGLGDLVATCSSPRSRNRRFGERLGAGESTAQILADSHQVAEGVLCCAAIRDLARRNAVEMPIVDGVVSVVAGACSPFEVLHTLMSRAARPERDGG